MKEKKSKKVILTLIIIITLILVAGILYTYFATDLLKTNKQLFFKYGLQIMSEDDGFFDNRLKQYNEKVNQISNENSGNLTVKVAIPTGEQFEVIDSKIIDKLNNMSIEFSGKAAPSIKKAEQDIQINYSNDVNFPIHYRKDNDIYGLQTKFIGSKYIAVEKSNLTELVERLNIRNAEDISDKINTEEINKLEFSNEEKAKIEQNYIQILNEMLVKDNFSKIEDINGISYILTLSGEKAKEIIKKELEILKDDTELMDKLNEIQKASSNFSSKKTTEINQDSVQELIESIEEAEIGETKITVTQQNKKLKSIALEVNNFSLKMEKQLDEDKLNYQISVLSKASDDEISEKGDIEVVVTAKINLQYQGLQTMENVKQNHTFVLDIMIDNQNMSYEYNYNNDVKFTDTVVIDGLNSENAIILNNYSEEQLNNLMNSIGQRLTEVNKDQMEDLELEEMDNPLLYSNPLTTNIMIITKNAIKSIEESSKRMNELLDGEAKEEEEINNQINNMMSELIKQSDEFVNEEI